MKAFSLVVVILLGVEAAVAARKHGYHFLWAAGRLVERVRIAARAGWLA